MRFKVGDRVEVLSGPPHVNHPEAVGPGTLLVMRADESGTETHKVHVDAVDDEWWYSEHQLCPLK